MNTEFIDDFILEYKNQPCLWQGKSEHFKNRKKRQEAYLKLIEVANRHGEHYNIEKTKQKINNLRCAFRVQLKKYTEIKNNKGKEEPYCPKRRYFESLLFLMDEEKLPTSTGSTIAAQITIPNSPVNQQTAKITDKLKGVTVTKIPSMSAVQQQQQPQQQTNNNNSLETSSNNEDEVELMQTKDDEDGVVELADYTIEESEEQILSDDVKDEEYVDEEVPKTDQNELGEVIIWNNEIKQNTPATITSIIKIPSSGIMDVSSHPITVSNQQSHQHHHHQHMTRQRTPSLSSSISSTTGLCKDDSGINHITIQQHHQPQQQQAPILHSQPPNKKIKIDCSSTDFEKLLSLACSRANNQDDDNYGIFGKMVAYKLRSMDSQQAFIAEKVIHDILLEGQMKLLTYPNVSRHSQHQTPTYVFATNDLNGQANTTTTTTEIVPTSAVTVNTSQQGFPTTIHYTTANNNGSQQQLQ
ncbi:hypothetical protein ACFFRR_008593 [Megaselia abdita]